MKVAFRGCLLGMVLLLVSCAATDSKIQTTADPQAELSNYRTFAFLEGGPKTEGNITDKRVHDRLRHMIALRLTSKGYAPAAAGQTGDLGVHFSGKVVPKQSVLMVGRPGPYNYSWGRTELGGYDTHDYREGTLYVDLVEVASNRLVWRTRIQEALSASYTEDNWNKIERALEEAFASVPPRR